MTELLLIFFMFSYFRNIKYNEIIIIIIIICIILFIFIRKYTALHKSSEVQYDLSNTKVMEFPRNE